MSQVIINEIPAGTIDGVNKSFTVAFTAQYFSDVLVDGADYTSYTFSGTTLTLSDAPTASLVVDYVANGSGTGSEITTLQDLREIFYNILREDESDSSSYPLTFVDLLLNSAQQRICHGRVVNPLNQSEVRKGQLPFINKEKFYSNIQPTKISTAVVVGDTTLTVTDTTNFPSSGALYVNGEILTYTSTTATEFIGATPTFAWDAGVDVSAVFALPDDYASTTNLVYNYNTKLEAQTYDDIFEQLNKNKGSVYNRAESNNNILGSPRRNKPFYTTKDNKYLIIFQLNNTGDSIRLRYEKQPSLMTTTVGPTIPNDIYAKTTIPYLAVGEMLYNRGEEGRASEILNFAMGQIKEMYSYYNNTSYEKISGTAYKMGKNTLNI